VPSDEARMTNLSSFVMPDDRADVAAIVDIVNALPEIRFLAPRLSGHAGSTWVLPPR
jgi:hypothetical protein